MMMQLLWKRAQALEAIAEWRLHCFSRPPATRLPQERPNTLSEWTTKSVSSWLLCDDDDDDDAWKNEL